MGYQSSRIVFGSKSVDAEAKTMQVTNWSNSLTYRSGNKAIYVSPVEGIPKVYECISAESYGEVPDYSAQAWKLLNGISFLKTIRVPDTEAERVINSKRQTFNAGSYVIKEESISADDPRYWLYKCIVKTNVYYDGFSPDKWAPVMMTLTKQVQPIDHKEVYYDDGKNKTKWHRAMYYWPDEDSDYVEEVSEFNEFVSYGKGELVLYSDWHTYHDDTYKCYEYMLDRPSQPSYLNENVNPPVKEYTQPSPLNDSIWKLRQDINYFDQTKAYKKNDNVIFNVYSDESSGSGQITRPVSIFNEEWVYVKYQSCLYRIKPSENSDIYERDLEKFQACSEHDFDYVQPRPEEDPDHWEWVPVTAYAKHIVDDYEIYGLYTYQSDDPKPKGKGFNHDDWEMLIVRQFNEIDTALGYMGHQFHVNDLVIAPYNGVWVLFKCIRETAPKAVYYLTSDCREDYKNRGFYHFISRDPNKNYDYGKSIDPSKDDQYSNLYWTVMYQTHYESSDTVKMYRANKDVPMGLFNKENWNIVSQQKISTDLYGRIWTKYSFMPGGDIPFGFEFLMQYEHPVNYYGRGLRFNKLQLFRGNNILSVGTKVMVPQNTAYSSSYRYSMKKIGQSAIVVPNNFNPNYSNKLILTFFIRKMFSNEWSMFDTNDIPELIGSTGHYLSIENANRLGINFWSENIITLTDFFPDISQEFSVIAVKKVTISDIVNKSYWAEEVYRYPKYDSMEALSTHSLFFDMFCSGFYIVPGFVPEFGYLKTDVLLPLPLNIFISEPCYQVEVYTHLNSKGHIFNVSLTGSPRKIKVFTNPNYAIYDKDVRTIDGYRVTNSYDILSGMYRYIREDLVFPHRKTASFTGHIFTDGYDGMSASDMHINTKQVSERWAQVFMAELRDAGYYANPIGVRIDHTMDGITLDGHTIDHTEIIEVSYDSPDGADILSEDDYTDYGIPNTPGGIHSINESPLLFGTEFFSPSKSKFYKIETLHCYFARELKHDMAFNDVGYYSLTVLSIIDVNNGISTVRALSRTRADGAYGSLAGGGVPWSVIDMNTIFSETSSPIYRNEQFLYVLNYIRHTEPGNDLIPGFSTGIWEIDLVRGTAVCDRLYENMVGSWSRKRQMRAVLDLCCVQKIPYYGNQTCHCGDKVIQYLNLFIVPSYVPTTTEKEEFYDELEEQWEQENCLTTTVSIWNYQDIPIISNSSSSVVGGVPYSTGDMIVNKEVSIEVYSGKTVKYELVVVLPNFKNLYPLGMSGVTSGTGLGCYNPLMAGAFFWLTTDDILYKAEPQYGGAEDGAQGFSGW